jgi:hypothetical protein
MTNNEKAATFIGWEPNSENQAEIGTLCQGHAGQVVETGTALGAMRVRCKHGQIWAHIVESDAPDMARPDNYMKALQAIAGRMQELELHCRDNGREWGLSLNDCDPISYHATVGDAVLAALAALYDVEHSDNACVKAEAL